ncbi:MAG: glutaredoxin family protein [Thermodesulfovibrionales bacterium]|nr:glutaredoxin family protein [Thermodesulfovibrionales bacterium]
MNPHIKIYTLSTCSHCKSTKKLLDECSIKYEFADVDLLSGAERQAIIEEVKCFNPDCSFPTIIIGDKVIIGFKEQEIRKALGL